MISRSSNKLLTTCAWANIICFLFSCFYVRRVVVVFFSMFIEQHCFYLFTLACWSDVVAHTILCLFVAYNRKMYTAYAHTWFEIHCSKVTAPSKKKSVDQTIEIFCFVFLRLYRLLVVNLLKRRRKRKTWSLLVDWPLAHILCVSECVWASERLSPLFLV